MGFYEKTFISVRRCTISYGIRPQLVRLLVVAVLRCRLPLAGSEARNKPGSQICFGVRFTKPLALGISSVLVLVNTTQQTFQTNRIGNKEQFGINCGRKKGRVRSEE
jgi:hypothetical protein